MEKVNQGAQLEGVHAVLANQIGGEIQEIDSLKRANGFLTDQVIKCTQEINTLIHRVNFFQIQLNMMLPDLLGTKNQLAFANHRIEQLEAQVEQLQGPTSPSNGNSSAEKKDSPLLEIAGMERAAIQASAKKKRSRKGGNRRNPALHTVNKTDAFKKQ